MWQVNVKPEPEESHEILETVQANIRPSDAGNKQLMYGASGVFPCARRKEHSIPAW